MRMCVIDFSNNDDDVDDGDNDDYVDANDDDDDVDVDDDDVDANAGLHVKNDDFRKLFVLQNSN